MTQPKRSKFSINRSLARAAYAEFQRRHGERPNQKWSGKDVSVSVINRRRYMRNQHDDRAGIQGESEV